MQNNKPQIVFTFPATLGGVSSFNYNIINNSLLIKNFHSKVILLKEKNDTRPLFTESFLVDEQILFEYNANENQYHLQKRLSNLLGNAEGAIVTDNGMTVEAARRFNNPKTIFNLIHDYYYVNQQTKLQDWSDVVIAHSSFFSDAVFASNPELYVNRSLYIPYANKSDPDTMYMHQAMRQPDKEQFKQAMLDEINAHTKNKHWEIIERNKVPEGVKVLPSVWAMKRKRRISTGKVYKWKARLNLHGGKQEHGISYWETYAATLTWPIIHFMLTQAIIMGWKIGRAHV